MSFGDAAKLSLQIEAETLRVAILTTLNRRHGELQALVDQEIERTAANLEPLLRQLVHDGIKDAIRLAVQDETWRLRQVLQPVINKAVSEHLAAILAPPAGHHDQ